MIASALLCLAAVVYQEARGEPLRGQQAVALVTLNRAEGQPRHVCHEVHRAGQYSFVGKGLGHHERDAWMGARKVAADVLYGRIRDFTNGSTYFHARTVRPSWRRTTKYVMTIGGHRFYKTIN